MQNFALGMKRNNSNSEKRRVVSRDKRGGEVLI
jgi:hypothetical protein